MQQHYLYSLIKLFILSIFSEIFMYNNKWKGVPLRQNYMYAEIVHYIASCMHMSI